jgi:dihydroflavonol-4-reductase
MAQVLVTGGCGFVGRHLVEALLARGDEVRVLDVSGAGEGDPPVEYIKGSVTDRVICERALEGIDRLYHMAGIAHLWCRNKDDFDLVNRRGTETILAAAETKGVERIVHCSTESILLPRRRHHRAIDESVAPSLDDMAGAYTRSKYLGERAALSAAERGQDIVVVNPTVPIGEGDRNVTPPAALFELFLAGGSPFFLDCVLNLVDVRDLADGIVRAGDEGRAGERYILGGENVALHDLLITLGRLSGRKMPKRRVPSSVALATGSIAGWIADNLTRSPPIATREGVLLALRSAPFDSAKAKRELGYRPGPIEQALTEVVEAFKRRADH